MAKGISLHVGLNAVDPNHYGGWDGQLIACEADAEDMQLIADDRGFASTLLLTNSATRKSITERIEHAAKNLGNDDIFFLSYSGHGGNLPDQGGDEDDGMDETWCLFDGELVDDELFRLWAKFKPGVRILVLSDSCYSGTVTKMAAASRLIERSHKPAIKAMPNEIALKTYQKNKKFYDQILSQPEPFVDDIEATVRLISGCQDNQLSEDGTFNGKFTGMLKRVWSGGRFRGDYNKFVSTIIRGMPARQTPNHYTVGRNNIDFDNQTPFTI